MSQGALLPAGQKGIGNMDQLAYQTILDRPTTKIVSIPMEVVLVGWPPEWYTMRQGFPKQGFLREAWEVLSLSTGIPMCCPLRETMANAPRKGDNV